MISTALIMAAIENVTASQDKPFLPLNFSGISQLGQLTEAGSGSDIDPVNDDEKEKND